ncbi:hypothetical protein VP150E351_P0064 [Vibrio phage 150E35-1]|nr:hypothetical protein VP150E351_P0064 [Vibrio phage 150E35-1]
MNKVICKICDSPIHRSWLARHVNTHHGRTPKEYILDGGEEPKCKCGNSCKFDTILSGYRDTCSASCTHTGRSRPEHGAKMRELHSSGLYEGTNHLVNTWNGSEEQKVAIRSTLSSRYFDKSSKDVGSEFKYRDMNMHHVISIHDYCESLVLYIVKNSVGTKIGATSVLQRRMKELDGELLYAVTGPVKCIAQLERDTLQENIAHTIYCNNKWSEYFNSEYTSELLNYVTNRVQSSETIESVNVEEIQLDQ